MVAMALLTLVFLSLSTKHVVFFVCVTCPCSFWTKCHIILFVYYLFLRVMKLLTRNEIAQVQIYYRPRTVDTAA